MIAPGGKLGRYHLRRPLGAGAMSAVYLAYDPMLDREVALKILPPELGRDETFRRRFHEEARALARVDHPNLVRIYTVGREEGISFYAMELVRGVALDEAISTLGWFDLVRAWAVFSQFLDGLEACHRAGIIHRDVKPANIMLDRSGRVTLMDFGLARRADRQSFTAAGSVLGTPEYMSPEQARGQKADERSDLYAAGVLLFEMLGGRPPFEGPDTIAILRKHVEAPVPSLRDLRRDVPVRVQEIIEKLLAKRPDDRYPHVRALREDLARVMPRTDDREAVVREIVSAVEESRRRRTREIEPETTSEPDAAPVRDRGERVRTWAAVAAAIVAVAALAVAVAALFFAPAPERQDVVAPTQRVGWIVTPRDGEPFEGTLVEQRAGPRGTMIFVFRLPDGSKRSIAAGRLKRMDRSR